jgi:hypothetical protein
MNVSELLDRATDSLEPSTPELVAGGTARGRRRRRLIAVAGVATGLGVCGIAAAVTVALIPGGSTPGSAGDAGSVRHLSTPLSSTSEPGGVAERRAARERAAVEKARAELVTAREKARAERVTARRHAAERQVLNTLTSLLPHGSVSHYSRRADSGYAAAIITWDDGHGAVEISASVATGAAGGLGAACQISTCTTRQDGSKLAVYLGHSRPGDPSTALQWAATLVRRDGVTVNVTEWNAPSEKGADPTRATPPLTQDELVAVVSNPHWTAPVD